jgi:CheY-like chemotaxis protein
MTPSSTTDFYFILIIILLSLVVGVYFYFKSKLVKQNSEFNETLSTVKDIEKNKNELLSHMSDDIYHLTKNLVNPEETKDDTLEGEILTSANNLRELLKIQANKIEVYQEKFVFSHMLDDVSTYLSSNFKNRNTEVIFDIDDNVPRYLTGDVIHFSRIINNILEFSIQATPQGKVTLSIRCDKPTSNDIILNVQIKDNGKGLSEEDFTKLFDLVYDDKRQEHTGLRLYIAKKLTLAIGGTIETSSGLATGNIFTLQIPMKLNEESTLQEFMVFKEGIKDKKVLIYSDKSATGDSLKKLFSYFYRDVIIAKREELEKRLVNFIDFDLIILDDIFFNTVNNEHLKLIKENKNLHIIAFSSIFSSNKLDTDTLVDMHIHTPSNLERIVELITQIESEKEKKEEPLLEVVSTREDFNENNGPLLVHNEPIDEAQNIDIDCFTYFKGARLLIVEDNLINQKIIVSVLKKSGMEIEIANNGQEALDILFIEKKVFDIILMDISMPVMDGLIATKRIREKIEYDRVPIITFTAFAMGAEIEEMFEAGCNAYLTKPLNIKKLYNVFNLFLSQINREVSLQKAIAIEGLDIEMGINNADESEVLYKETLKEFVLVYKDMVELMPKWLKEKRYERVKLACNEIQGMLSAIGAYEMKELVDEMQKNFLYSNEEFLDKYILLYPEKLNNLMSTIHHYTSKTS